MKTIRVFLLVPLLFCLLVIPPAVGLWAAQREGENAEVTAFVNVNVIPMIEEKVRGNQTVVVRSGRVESVGPAAAARVPAGAILVDGRGKYLMPGLIDMHVHAFTDDRTWLLYLANGVTSVRNMAGNPGVLEVRRKIMAGEVVGPTLYTCGPILMGYKDPAAARRIVSAQSDAGYDCFKIYNIIDWTKDAYLAAVEEGVAQKRPAVGHLPYNLPLEVTLKGRQTVEHVEQFYNAHFSKLPGPLDESQINNVVRMVKAEGVSVTATLAVYHAIALIAGDESFQELRRRPELDYVPPSIRERWLSPSNRYRRQFTPAAVPNLLRTLAFLRKLTKAFHEAGVKILLGTDAAEDQPFMLPGFSIHDELRELAAAGLTPYEALLAGTRDAARLLSSSGEFGTVAAGQRADLLLLDRNPLEDVANLKSRAGVMVRGRWLPEADLRARLAGLKATYGGR